MAEAIAPAKAEALAAEKPAGRRPLPLPWIVASAFVVAAVAAGYAFGIAIAILALAGGSIVAVAYLGYRTALAIADSSTGVQLADVRASAAQDRKRAALAALKDLEYERSIGNVTEEDYEQLLARYREEAKTAMRLVDDERRELRERAEELVREALVEVPEKKAKKTKAKKAVAERPCPSCSTDNDPDASFCKKCGKPIETSKPAEGEKEGDT